MSEIKEAQWKTIVDALMTTMNAIPLTTRQRADIVWHVKKLKELFDEVNTKS